MNVWRGQKRQKGKVYVWGWNYCCQLGLEDNKQRIIPTELAKLAKAKVIYIASGDTFCTAVTEKG